MYTFYRWEPVHKLIYIFDIWNYLKTNIFNIKYATQKGSKKKVYKNGLPQKDIIPPTVKEPPK